MRWRLLKWAAGLVLTLIVVATLAGAYLFTRAMPTYSGAERLPGLSAEARVWRDAYGVPHIFAASMDDAARVLGYLHASERLFQMEIQRRVGQGRVAEIQGADLLGVDKFIRTLGFYREAQTSFSSLSPWAQKRLTAYADGVNAFLESHKDALPPEFLLAGDRPEPWKPADSLVWGKLLSLQLSNNYKLEALRAHLRQKLGAEQAGWLFPAMKPDAPITTKPVIDIETRARRERPRPDRRSHRHKARRVERMGRRRIAHRHRQADPRQRPASRTRRADPLVSRADRHARRFAQGRDGPRRADRAARPERQYRLGLHHRRHRRAGPFHRDGRSQRSVEISDARRPEGVRYARRDDPCERRSGRQAHGPDDPARSGALRRQRGSREHRRARKGGRPRLYRPWRPRHDRGGDDAPQCGAQLGRVPRRFEALSDARRRISSMPMSPATSASSVPASFPCASQATD